MQLTEKWLGSSVSYIDALEIQQKKLSEILSGTSGDTLYLLEHAPVYTIGRTRDQSSLNSSQKLPHPVVETNRGGQATFHGPGQLVGYPIINLVPLGKDLHAFIRSIEKALINSCQSFGINARRRENLTGVWVQDRKIAAIGIGVRKWISMHGFAINISQDCLNGFASITPCGIDGVKVTCLNNEVENNVSLKDFCQVVTYNISRELKQLED